MKERRVPAVVASILFLLSLAGLARGQTPFRIDRRPGDRRRRSARVRSRRRDPQPGHRVSDVHPVERERFLFD